MEIFPFIVGCARSGTTLVRAMLDSHPALAIPRESHFIDTLARRRATFEGPTGVDVDALIAELLTSNRVRRRWKFDEQDLIALFAEKHPADLPEAIRMLYRLYATRQNKTRFGDKTPRYVLEIPLLGELFPESRFVHVIRDGRDVALSILDRNWKSVESISQAATFWKKRVERGRNDGRKMGSERYMEVRYEDLILEPRQVLSDLCEFLELRFDPEMLSYYRRPAYSSQEAKKAHRHQRLDLPPTQGLRDWRSQMRPRDVALFEAIAGDTLQHFGYERATRTHAGIRLASHGALLWDASSSSFKKASKKVKRSSFVRGLTTWKS